MALPSIINASFRVQLAVVTALLGTLTGCDQEAESRPAEEDVYPEGEYEGSSGGETEDEGSSGDIDSEFYGGYWYETRNNVPLPDGFGSNDCVVSLYTGPISPGPLLDQPREHVQRVVANFTPLCKSPRVQVGYYTWSGQWIVRNHWNVGYTDQNLPEITVDVPANVDNLDRNYKLMQARFCSNDKWGVTRCSSIYR